jgi:hypothetical protein
LHLVGILFPHIINDAWSKPHQIYTYVSGGQYAQNLLSLGEGKLQIKPHKISEHTFGVEK